MKFYNNVEKKQDALLVTVNTGEFDADASLDELCELAKSAGANVVSTVKQNREKPDTATCVGLGILEEIKNFCENNNIDVIVFDLELTPTQIRNIEKFTNVRTIDRTMLILDIFALHAKSKEGKLQVELAQLKYMLPRLTGKGIEMSRLGGGIGTRGPGETKLETDRRHIRMRIESLKVQLATLEKRRKMLRERRKKEGVITVAIVGYTNAGKSTLMNTLTNAGVLSENKLFATLDPTSRALELPSGVSVMLIDTVGFVRRLPHHLVEAFKSTLEEAAYADIILNVCDASSAEADVHLRVTTDLLNELGYRDRPMISVLNKYDIANVKNIEINGQTVKISAKTGIGIDKLLEAIEASLPIAIKRADLLIPFSEAALINTIRNEGKVLLEEYRPEGIYVKSVLDEILFSKFKKFELKAN